MDYLKTNCILIGAILLWASAFVGIKMALLSYSPGALALLRFLVASGCMALIYHFQAKAEKRMPWRDRIQLLIAGMAGIGIYNICLNYGEITVSAGIASFIIGLMPVITVFLSLVFFKERLGGGAWAGILISMLGLFLMTLGEQFSTEVLHGVLLILVSAFMSAIVTIIKKRFLSTYSSTTVITWVMWGGTLLLSIYFPALLQEIGDADYQSTAVVVYMGVFPAAVAYLAWTYVLKKITASKAAITLYILPFASTLLGFLLLDEQPSLISLLGGGIALLGALIAQYFQGRVVLDMSLTKKVVAV